MVERRTSAHDKLHVSANMVDVECLDCIHATHLYFYTFIRTVSTAKQSQYAISNAAMASVFDCSGERGMASVSGGPLKEMWSLCVSPSKGNIALNIT